MKKPRNKKYKPRAVRIPMTGANHNMLALEIHMAIEALCCAPGEETFHQISKMVGTLRDAGMSGPDIDAAATILTGIFRRYELIGVVTVEPDEATALRAASGGIDTALPKINMPDFFRAVAQMQLLVTALDIEAAEKELT